MLDIKNITQEVTNENYKELPLYFPSPIYYSLYAAIRFSILLTSEKTYPWFYSNFIQLRFDNEIFENQLQYDNEKKRKLGFPDHILHIYPIEVMKKDYKGASLFFDEINLNSNIFQFKKETLISEMVDYLNNGYYITTHLDVSKLPGTRYYNGIPTVHSVLIYAYDLEEKCFKHTDFQNNGSMTIIKIDFEDFINAFFSDSVPESQRIEKMRSKYYLGLCKINDENTFSFDVESIKLLLSDYLNASNTSKRYNLLLPEKRGIYGVEVYNAIIKYIKTTSSLNDMIDYRVFHVIYEHKKMMTCRFEYFESIGILDSDLNISKKFSAVEKKANDLRNLVLKYTYTKEKNILNLIISELNEICSQERPIIAECINRLSSDKIHKSSIVDQMYLNSSMEKQYLNIL